MSAQSDHSLEFLLAFDGRRHLFESGYWVKFEIKRAEPTGNGRKACAIHSRCTIRMAGGWSGSTMPMAFPPAPDGSSAR